MKISRVLVAFIVPLLIFVAPTASFAKRRHVTDQDDINSVFPKPDTFGLGGMVGSIVSLTGKYWLSRQGALDFGVGIVGSPWTVFYADYLWHLPRVFGTDSKFGRESSLYFGGGGGLGFWRDHGGCGHWSCGWAENTGTGVFIRGLAGLEWYPRLTHLGVFGELGPSVMVIPGSWTTIDFGIGLRYYF